MKKISLLFYLFVVFISLSLLGCSQTADDKTVFSNDLLYDSKLIDQIGMGVVIAEGMSEGTNIYDKEQIDKLVAVLMDIELEELSQKQVEDIFSDGKVWSEKVKYNLTLISTSQFSDSDIRAGFNGAAWVLNDGNIVFVETKTMGPFEEGEVQKSLFYISAQREVDAIKQIVKIIQESIDIQ